MAKRLPAAKRANRANPRIDRNAQHIDNILDFEVSKKTSRVRRSESRHPVQDDRPNFKTTTKVELVPKNLAQERYIDALYDESKSIVFGIGPAGTGKAQPLDAKILTPNGWSSMGAMKIGSVITNAKGENQNVIGVYPQGKKEIFVMTFEDGRTTECCAEHLWEVFYYDWKTPRILSTAQIIDLKSKKSKTNRLYVKLFTPAANDKAALLPIDPYVLGCLIGDGCFSSNSLNRIKKALVELKLMNCTSHTKFIPNSYLESSTKQRLDLLRGLMDTDGTTNKGHISYCTTSNELALNVQYLVRSLGGLCKISEKKTSYTSLGIKKTGFLSYNLSIRLKSPEEVFLLSRKIQKVTNNYQYANSLKLRISSIKSIGVKEAQCIAVDHKDHLYVTDDFIVTHNTYLAVLYAVEQLQAGNIKKIVITRPMVTSDATNIGAVPGSILEKLTPYLGALISTLKELYPVSVLTKLMEDEVIHALPIGLMRGHTFKNEIVIGDEFQDTDPHVMKMFLTRIGEGSRMIITGDLAQTDKGFMAQNGLKDFIERLEAKNGSSMFEICKFACEDIERHPAVAEALRIYGEE